MLLDRNLEQQTVEQRERTSGTGPPKEMPDIERYVTPRWPRSAKTVVAVLGVLTVAGVFGTAIQYFGDDTGDGAEITQLTEERDELAVENADLLADVEQLELDNSLLGTELDETSAGLATATGQVGTLTNRVGELTGQVDTLTGRVDTLQVTNDAVTAERDALVAMFPMIVDTSLVGVDVTGTYDVDWIPAYNSGLVDIALPSATQVTISPTAEGWMQVSIPGVVTADLARTDGALFTMVDTTTAVPPVDGVARTARVAITVYAGETVTDTAGVTTVTSLGMSVAISTPAFGSAPAGVALYGAELDR
jgi:outer membrane murein-binding lipoprotein Lpp